MASATSYWSSSSNAAVPERAFNNTSPSRRRRPSSERRVSSRSSTNRNRPVRPRTSTSSNLPQIQSNLIQWQDTRLWAGRNGRFRHCARIGAFRTLHDRDAARFDHCLQAVCAITVGSGKHHANQTAAISVRRAFKQDVDRRARVQDWLLARQRQAFIGLDQQMIVRRGEISDPRFDRLLVLGFTHADFAARPKEFREKAGPVGRKVNDNQNWEGKD